MLTTTLANATITIQSTGRDTANRVLYRYTITAPSWQHTNTDIYSEPNARADETRALATLLSNLTTSAESYAARNGENADLFPYIVAAWADLNSDEIANAADTLHN